MRNTCVAPGTRALACNTCAPRSRERGAHYPLPLLVLLGLLGLAHLSYAKMGQGGESAAQVRGDGRPSPSPTPAEKADPIAAVGRRLSLSTAEVVRLRAVAAAVPLHTKVRSAQKDDAAVALLLLVDQACAAPDYATLGKGWFYPDSRMEYRRRLHDVFTCAASRARQLASAAHLTERLKVGQKSWGKVGVWQQHGCFKFLREEAPFPSALWVGGPALNTRTEMFRAFTMLQCTRIHCFDGSHWMTIIRLRRSDGMKSPFLSLPRGCRCGGLAEKSSDGPHCANLRDVHRRDRRR